ncbi:MAG: glycosyltransferase family 2 protein [Rikenellaceae bacterium]
MISVIIPLYNAAKTLDRCIESALNQSYPDFELLCIDDGSRDETLQLLREYEVKDSRVRVFTKENGGVSSARNIGIKEAKGEFITFLDADDWVERDWLRDYIDNYQGEDLLFQNAIWEKSDGSQFLRSITIDRANSCADKILYLYDYSTINYVWATIFRRSIIIDNNILFNTEIKYNEDCEFVLHYCSFIKDINILPKYIRNYHYVFPDGERAYQEPSYIRALALKLVALRGYDMCREHGASFLSINRRTTSDLLYTVIMAYRLGLPKEERLKILDVATSLPYRRETNGLKFKVLNLLITPNIWFSDQILKLILGRGKK